MEYKINELDVQIVVTRRTAKNGKPFHEYLIYPPPGQDEIYLECYGDDVRFYNSIDAPKVFDFDCKIEKEGIYKIKLRRFKKGTFWGWELVDDPVLIIDVEITN